MADYNVNMKQWNGTSFDNVLPLAYNAKQLGGQSLAEVKQWVQDNGLLLYTGQYTGTGTYGQSNPTVLTFPFEPIIWIPPLWHEKNQYYDRWWFGKPILTSALSTSWESLMRVFAIENDAYNSVACKMSTDRKQISFYNSSNAAYQSNDSGVTYYYAAIGGYDIGGN